MYSKERAPLKRAGLLKGAALRERVYYKERVGEQVYYKERLP